MEKEFPLAAKEEQHSEEGLGPSSLYHVMEYLVGSQSKSF